MIRGKMRARMLVRAMEMAGATESDCRVWVGVRVWAKAKVRVGSVGVYLMTRTSVTTYLTSLNSPPVLQGGDHRVSAQIWNRILLRDAVVGIRQERVPVRVFGQVVV